MPLTPGAKLGPYEIQSPLGAGGMGEVYRARDTRLDRIVAIKILASHLSSSPELKQRMEREARAISSLNHPCICQLYDIGAHDGAEFLVMEFLEGETLAERLRKTPVPLAEIYKIGIAVAEALAVAHQHGIVHRDLKPGNIMLTQAGAKLMDFGLAKPFGMSAASSTSMSAPPSFTAAATLSGPSPLSPLTTAGSIVGTIQYMSPEQIEGKEADARSDIFAFGAVLYEMAAGKRPFEGKSQISLASSILEKDPDPLLALKPQTPPAFDHVVNTCLQKIPGDRYLAAHDIKLELQWIATGKPVPEKPVETVAPATAKRRTLLWSAAVVAAILIGFAAGLLLQRPAAPAPSVRAFLNPPDKAVFNLTGDEAGPPVISPDGTSIAFTASSPDSKTFLWIRGANAIEAHQVAGTDNAIFPFWSPDGRSLGFFSDSKLKIIDIETSSVQVLADAPFGRGGTWGADGVILFSPATQAPLMRVSVTGGAPVPLTKLDATLHTSHRWPFFLPDGKHFLYAAIHHDPSKSANNALYYASVDGAENRQLLRCQSNAIYADGYLLFARGDQLMAQSFDPTNGKLSGDVLPAARGVVNDIATWHMDATASNNGLLLFGSGGTGDWQLVWFDRATKQIATIADKLANLQMARLSPQGDRVALWMESGGQNDIWVLDLARGVKTRLTFGPTANTYPVWSPDGKWIAYDSDRNGRSNLCRKRSDGSGAEETLHSDTQITIPNDWSRDGKKLLFLRGPIGNNEIWVLPLDGDRTPVLLVKHAENTFNIYPTLSPNGRWLAYSTNESGSPQVFVVGFNGAQGKWQVSASAGLMPEWGADGKTLYYLDVSYNLYAVPVAESGGALQFGTPQTIVVGWSAPQVFYDVSPDGKRILLDRIAQQVNPSVTVVTNFPATLKR